MTDTFTLPAASVATAPVLDRTSRPSTRAAAVRQGEVLLLPVNAPPRTGAGATRPLGTFVRLAGSADSAHAVASSGQVLGIMRAGLLTYVLLTTPGELVHTRQEAPHKTITLDPGWYSVRIKAQYNGTSMGWVGD